MTVGGDLTTLHPDHLGSTAVTTDESGTVSELLDYYPYGEELSASATYSDAPETAYTFGGKEHNDDTGLSYFEARHYKPEIGKFISMDPFPRRAPEYMLPDPQSWNSYAYARNNPLVYTDPSGESADVLVDGGSFAVNTGKWFYNTGKGLFAGAKGDFDTANAYFDAATGNAKDALTDVAFAAVPGVTGAGVKYVDDAASLVDDVVGSVKGKVDEVMGGTKSASGQSTKQMGEQGIEIAGAGTKTQFRDAGKWAEQYGGEAGDYAKMTSSSIGQAPDGRRFQTHWVENVKTGERYGQKTKFLDP